MLGSTILEVAIGLTFVFLLLSLCATALVEGIVEWRQWRGRLLHGKLQSLLGPDLRDVLYQDRRIADLASGDPVPPARWEAWIARWPWASKQLASFRRSGVFMVTSHFEAVAAARKLNARRLPSRIPDEVFVEIVLDWLQGVQLPQQMHPDFANERTLPYRLATLWHAMNLRADGSQPALREELLRWYRQAMDRASGEYKRRIRLALYAIGAILVMFTNADTLYIAGRLHEDPALRASYVSLSERVAAECPQGVDACSSLDRITKDILKNPALGSSGLLGWSDEAWHSLSLQSLLGWLLTVFAIGLGADFWFGALRKMLSIRSAGVPAAEAVGTRVERQPDTLAPRAGAPRHPLDLSAPQVKGLRGFQPLRYAESDVHAFWLAHFASFAYSEAEQLVESPLMKAHGIEVQPFDTAGTQGFIFSSDAACILAFRGTEMTLEDWMTDADARQHEPPWEEAGEGVGIHKGFHDALERVWDEVATRLTEARRPIWITGHSLGGALALLAASRLTRERPALPVAGVYTFGQPRIGSNAWTKTLPIQLQQRIFRYVNDNDIVPLVPPQSPIDYEHVGQARYFDGSGRLHHTRTVWERIAEQITPALSIISAGGDAWAEHARDHVKDRVADHSMARYIECLERLDAVRALWNPEGSAPALPQSN
ncbi:MAG: lipase family protein [Rhizobium sp.]|nr:lipase family protein [Rhizobium sp.]